MKFTFQGLSRFVNCLGNPDFLNRARASERCPASSYTLERFLFQTKYHQSCTHRARLATSSPIHLDTPRRSSWKSCPSGVSVVSARLSNGRCAPWTTVEERADGTPADLMKIALLQEYKARSGSKKWDSSIDFTIDCGVCWT